MQGNSEGCRMGGCSGGVVEDAGKPWRMQLRMHGRKEQPLVHGSGEEPAVVVVVTGKRGCREEGTRKRGETWSMDAGRNQPLCSSQLLLAGAT